MDQKMHLAQLNIARLLAPVGDPRVAAFIDNLERINGIGKRAPGFVWIMEGDDPSAGNTDTSIDGDPLFVSNLTVWEDVASLKHFVFKTLHAKFMKRQAEWFEPAVEQHFVMWPVPLGHRPTLEEALARRDYLREHGNSDHAFDWRYRAS